MAKRKTTAPAEPAEIATLREILAGCELRNATVIPMTGGRNLHLHPGSPIRAEYQAGAYRSQTYGPDAFGPREIEWLREDLPKIRKALNT